MHSSLQASKEVMIKIKMLMMMMIVIIIIIIIGYCTSTL